MATSTTEQPKAASNTTPRLGISTDGKKATAFTLLRHPGGLWRFLTDKEAPKMPRVLALLVLAYVILPFDLSPDVVPLLGWLDDMGLTAAAVGYIASQAASYANTEEKKPQDERIEVKAKE